MPSRRSARAREKAAASVVGRLVHFVNTHGFVWQALETLLLLICFFLAFFLFFYMREIFLFPLKLGDRAARWLRLLERGDARRRLIGHPQEGPDLPPSGSRHRALVGADGLPQLVPGVPREDLVQKRQHRHWPQGTLRHVVADCQRQQQLHVAVGSALRGRC